VSHGIFASACWYLSAFCPVVFTSYTPYVDKASLILLIYSQQGQAMANGSKKIYCLVPGWDSTLSHREIVLSRL